MHWKDYWSDRTTVTAEYVIDWIREHQTTCWPERSPMPEWFYPQIATILAPTVHDITTRHHRGDDGQPYTEEETRDAVARSIALRIFKIWGRIRLGTFVCRRCGGKILGEAFVFDWRGSGPYNIWHSECYALQQVDPQPFYTSPPKKRTEAEQYRIDLNERKDMIQAERHRQQGTPDLQRQNASRSLRERSIHPLPRTSLRTNSGDEERVVKKETGVESVEYHRTPFGKNVSHRAARENKSNEET